MDVEQQESQPPEAQAPEVTPPQDEMGAQDGTGASSEAKAEVSTARTEGSGVEEAAPREAGGAEAGNDGAPAAKADSTDPATGEAEGGAKKKKRRRRRKKGDGKSGAAGVTGGKGEASAAGDVRAPHAPFVSQVQASASQHHAFSAGEIVAGRVIGPGADGTVLIDLFGKAVAVLHDREPLEVQPDPSPADPASHEIPPSPSGDTGADAAEAQPVASETQAVPEETGAAPAAGEREAAREREVTTPEGAEASLAEGVPDATDPDEGAVEPGLVEGSVGVKAEVSVTAEGGELQATGEPVATQASSAPQDVAAQAEPPPLPRDPDEDLGETLSLQSGAIFRGRVGAVSESGHVALVNRFVDRPAAKRLIRTASEERHRVVGFVFGFNRGGFDIIVKGIRVFCPASGMALGAIDDPAGFVGRSFEFLVPPKKGRGGSIVVSRRSILEREQKKARKARLKELKVGEELAGTVTQVREFGAFVDLGDGVEGLVHQSEMSWNRAARPADLAKPGDAVQVKVLRIGTDAPEREPSPKSNGEKASASVASAQPEGAEEGSSAETTTSAGADTAASAEGAPAKQKRKRDKQVRVSLSMKVLLPDPWSEHEDVLKVGSCQKGRVVRTTEFGAFIELVPGVEGLLHISELGKNLNHAKQVLSDNETLDVVVERVDRGQRRISLSRLSPAELKALAEGKLNLENRPKTMKPGTHLRVVIERVEHAGLSVNVDGVVGRRARGFIPNRELGSFSSGEKRRSLTPGFAVEAKVVGAERDGGLKLSIKGRESDEERKAVREYRKESAQQGLGTFGDLLKAKLAGDGNP